MYVGGGKLGFCKLVFCKIGFRAIAGKKGMGCLAGTCTILNKSFWNPNRASVGALLAGIGFGPGVGGAESGIGRIGGIFRRCASFIMGGLFTIF